MFKTDFLSQGGGADWFEQKSDHAVTRGTEYTYQIILQVGIREITLSPNTFLFFQRVRSEKPEETDWKDLQEGGFQGGLLTIDPKVFSSLSPMKVVHDKEKAINVTEHNLKDFVGKPVFSR